MDTTKRDRAVIGGAVLLVLATAGLVLATVLRAQADGTRALQRLQLAQVQQLARSMDTRIAGVFESFQGLAGAPPAWHAAVRDPADKARIDTLQALNPKARTGFFLVNTGGVVTNGTLLRDPNTVGSVYARPGLEGVLAGTPAILPVGPGLTTAQPVITIAYPLRNATQQVIGAMLVESDVSVESAFNEEVAQLRSGKTGEFTFVDEAGVVIASSNAALLGKPLDEPVLAKGVNGFTRAHGQIVVVEPVKSAGWRSVFRQDVDDFEGALTGPLRSALAYVIVAGLLGAFVALVTLARRLRRAREEQRRLEEIAAVREEFISIVSHELRTPVAGMMGFLQTTLDHWEVMTEDERQRAISRAMSSARRLHSLTRDVLDTSSIEASGMTYSLQDVDLREEISQTVAAERDLRPDRVITLDVPDSPAWVRCDGDRIRQVMTNLLDNAVKSSPPLSPVEVTVTDDGTTVEIAVCDHGPGLSDAELARVFEKFVRGRTSTPSGTGLGLYISRRLVEAQGGTIRAGRGADGGAVFVVSLPRAAAPAEPVGR
ncbi:MAG TPA: sensor histidine kinase [Mycobacteriales bacterium]